MTATSWNREAAGLAALWDDLRATPPAKLAAECENARMNLDLFVSDELDGADVRVRHPRIFGHLQVCGECRAAHDSLFDLLSAEAQGVLADLPPRPVFNSKSATETWRLQFLPATDQARPALLFVFAPSYLRQSLQPLSAAGRRSVVGMAADRLLLSHTGETPAGEVIVQLYARPDAADPTVLRLALVAVGEPMPAAAELTWGGQTWAVPLGPDGDGVCGPVPVAALDQAQFAPEAFCLRLVM